MVDTDDTRRKPKMPRVWHKLPIGELKKLSIFNFINIRYKYNKTKISYVSHAFFSENNV